MDSSFFFREGVHVAMVAGWFINNSEIKKFNKY
jgi:hypothetical protein